MNNVDTLFIAIYRLLTYTNPISYNKLPTQSHGDITA